MGYTREHVDSVVVDVLGPYLGASMARAAVDGHCRSLKIEGAAVEDADVARLVERLRQGMNVFVGPEKAGSLAAQLRDDLSGGVRENAA